MEQVTIETVSSLVGSYGFPIAVTWFLLTKGSTVIKSMTDTLNNMTSAIVELKVTVTSLSARLDRLDNGEKKEA